MWDFLTAYGFWLIVVGLPVVGWILTEAMENWRKVRESEHIAALKQSMIERGMSAEEIEAVLRAGNSGKEQVKQTT